MLTPQIWAVLRMSISQPASSCYLMACTQNKECKWRLPSFSSAFSPESIPQSRFPYVSLPTPWLVQIAKQCSFPSSIQSGSIGLWIARPIENMGLMPVSAERRVELLWRRCWGLWVDWIAWRRYPQGQLEKVPRLGGFYFYMRADHGSYLPFPTSELSRDQ